MTNPDVNIDENIDVFVEEDVVYVNTDEQEVINLVVEQDEVLLVELNEGIPGAKGDPGEKGDKGDKGDPGERGLPGRDGVGSDGTAAGINPTIYHQDMPDNPWVFAHNFPYRPVVVVYDNNNDEIEADISHPLPHLVVVGFAHEMTGVVQLF